MNAFNVLFGVDEEVLGREVNGGGQVRLSRPKASTYILGGKGTGKSTLMAKMILADIYRDDMGVVVIDPHGDLCRSLLPRIPREHAGRVILVDPVGQMDTPLGLNVVEWSGGIKEYGQKFEALMAACRFLWYESFQTFPTMQNTLETLVQTVLAGYPTYQTHFLHLFLLLRNDQVGEFWRKKLSVLTEDNVAVAAKWSEWQKSGERRREVESSKNKINHLLQSKIIQNILCQPQTSPALRFQEVLGQRQVLLVNLHGLDEDGQKLLGSLILTQLKAMAFLREKEEDRVPCHIYVDEFHIFAPEAVETIINQCAKFGLFCTLAHQTRAQIEPKALAAADTCGNRFVFKIGADDAKKIAHHFIHNEDFPEDDRIDDFDYYEAMSEVEKEEDGRIFTKQIRLTTYAQKDEVNPEIARWIEQRSHRFGRPITEVEKGIRDLCDPTKLYAVTPPRSQITFKEMDMEKIKDGKEEQIHAARSEDLPGARHDWHPGLRHRPSFVFFDLGK